jgi:hypothetical protein
LRLGALRGTLLGLLDRSADLLAGLGLALGPQRL